MSIQIIPQETLGAGLGRGLGQGISQQLPEEIQRYRTRKGLEGVLGQSQGDPLKTLAGLATIPGLDSSLINIIAPLAMQRAASRQGQELAQAEGLAKGEAPQQLPTVSPRLSTTQSFRDFESPVPPTPQEIDALASQRFDSAPAYYGNDFSKAQADAEKRLTDIYQGNVKKSDRIAETGNFFDAIATEFLGKPPAQVGGKLGQQLYRKLKEDALQESLDTTKKPRSISEKYARELEKGINAQDSLNDFYREWGVFKGKGPSQENLTAMRRNITTLKVLGAPMSELIDSVASSQHVDRALASYFVDPTAAQTKAGRTILDAPKGISPRRLAQEVAKNIRPDDVTGSLVFMAKAAGVDPIAFQNALSESISADKITDFQARQLREQLTDRIPSLAQFWWMNTMKNWGKDYAKISKLFYNSNHPKTAFSRDQSKIIGRS